MELPDFGELERLFVEEIPLHRTAKTIQILLLRQTHDYSIFRTEETRELNIVTLPNHAEDPTSVMRVAMLASKQKAPENRHYLSLVRTLMGENDLNDDQRQCALKDKLCQQCPRCVLFGAVSTKTDRGSRFNIKHRVSYSTAYSLETYDEISEAMTFNAVNSVNQSTEQALGVSENIVPLANFLSIVTLNSVTKKEFIMYLKAILSLKSYGAETRVKGDMVNNVLGIVGGLEEIITPLDLLLEVSTNTDDFFVNPVEKTYEILSSLADYAVFREYMVLLEPKEIEKLVKYVTEYDTSKEFVTGLYREAESFHEKLSNY